MGKRGAWQAAAVAAFLAAGSVFGHWAMPTLAPVDRIATNAAAYVKEHPQDANGYYVLGRVHGLAFTLKSRSIAVWDGEENAGKPPSLAADFQQHIVSWEIEKHPERVPTKAELTRHLAEAVRNGERAIALDDAPAHYFLGLAYVLDSGTVLAEETDVIPGAKGAAPTPESTAGVEQSLASLADRKAAGRPEKTESLMAQMPGAGAALLKHAHDQQDGIRDAVREVLTSWWRERAIDAYYQAYKRSIADDLKIEEQPLVGLRTLVGYEAAEGYSRLVKARGVKGDDERKRLAQVEQDLQTLRKKPPNRAITPIVFSVDAERPLASLLTPDSAVGFDLDGTGQGLRWSWVRPDTGILVWDPEGRGKIESGRQLFGSVTWWMFFEDGYKALDALDDNRDGELSGAELAGIAVWFDRNSNGVSDSGEVVSLAAAGIAGISVHATSQEDGCPANRSGLRMKDGRALPTYDWIAHSAGGAS